jgi:hypothetical protein
MFSLNIQYTSEIPHYDDPDEGSSGSELGSSGSDC